MTALSLRGYRLASKIATLCVVTHFAVSAQNLTKEYIYVGDRLVAVEQAAGAAPVNLAMASLTSGGQGISGGDVQVTFEYSNDGPATSQATRIAFYFSVAPDATIEATDAVSPTTHAIPAGFSGSSSPVNLTVQIPALPNGDYFFGAYIDDQDVVAESNDGDNTILSATGAGAAGAFTVTPPGALAPEIISLDPTSQTGSVQAFQGVVRDGDGFADLASARMLVNGSQSAVNACYVQYTAGSGFSLRNNADTAWISAGTASVANNGQCLLDAAASSATDVSGDLVVSWAVTFTSAFSGAAKSMWLEATDLAGNSTTSPVLGSWTVPQPDLSLSNPSLPGGSSPTEGQELTVTVQADNLGPQILQTVEVGLYTTSQGTSTPPAANPANRVGSCGVSLPNGFPADGSASCQGIAIIPTTGLHRIWAIIDDPAAVSESNETNNAIQVADVDVQPAPPSGDSDLRVTLLGVSPSSISQGSSGSFNVSFVNDGTSPTETGFDVGIYFSPDPTITTSDRQVGQCSWSQLSPGPGVSCAPTSFSTANIPAGTYYVGAIVDNGGVIAELDETNNVLSAYTGQVTITTGASSGPDVFTYLSVTQPEASPGEYITYAITIFNQGNAIAFGAFSANLYLSTTSSYTIDSDTYLGSCTSFDQTALNPQPTLPYSSSCGATSNLLLPANLASGQYFIFAVLDYWNGTQDTDKANNFGFDAIDIDSPVPPEAVSVTPSSGTGLSQTFSIRVRDDNGADDIEGMLWLLNGSLVWGGACGVWYQTSVDRLYIIDDDIAEWDPNFITPGSGTLSNSSCTIDGSGVSVTANGDELELTLPVTFAAGLGSTQKHWINVKDFDSAAWVGWGDEVGEWTLPGPTNSIPTPISVTPASGSGLRQTFSLRYQDADGVSDLSELGILINQDLDATNACYLRYSIATSEFRLLNDTASAWSALTPAGFSTPLENSACRVYLQNVAVATIGDEVTLDVSIEFLAGFEGLKNVYLVAYDDSGESIHWQALGTWNVVDSPQLPQLISVSPSGPSQASTTFTAIYRDVNGGSDITDAQLMADLNVDEIDACSIRYNRPSNQLYLRNDSATAWLGPITPGSGSLENTTCTVTGLGASASVVNDELRLVVPVTAKLSANYNLYLSASDTTGSTSWTTFGAWNLGSCAASLDGSPSDFTSAGGTGSVSVSIEPGCAWSASVSNTAWLTITSGSSGTGPGTVDFSVAANSGSAARNGSISVEGQSFAITQSGNNPPADDPPTVTLDAVTSPASGTISLTATASDDNGVTEVRFYVDGTTLIDTDPSAPYSASWDTTTVSDGAHTLTAVAVDTISQETTSAGVAVTVDNSSGGGIERIGAVEVESSLDNAGSFTLSVPSDATLAVLTVSGWQGQTDLLCAAGGASFDVAGNAMSEQYCQGPIDPANMIGVWCLESPPTGTQTFNFDLTGPQSCAEGCVYDFTYLKGATSCTVRDAGGERAFGTAPVSTGALTAQPGDYVLAHCSWFSNSDGASPAWTGATEIQDDFFNATNGVIAETFATGDTTITCDDPPTAGNWSAVAGVVITPAAPVDAAPTVALDPVSSPATGTVALTATASDDNGVTEVRFYVDGTTLIETDTIAPYSASWDTTAVSDGAHTLTAVAVDTISQETTSAGVAVTVDNSAPADDPPTVTLDAVTSPASGTISLTATASDDNGVTEVRFYVDGTTLIETDTSAPYSASWDTTAVSDGAHTLTAVAVDTISQETTSAGVNVTVDNSGGGPAWVTDALEVFYRFDEGSGTVVGDSSVHNRDGTLAGSGVWTSLGMKAGYVTTGLSALGSTQLNALNNESFTVIWVGKLEVTGGWETLVSMSGSGYNFNLIHKDAVTRRAGLNTDEGSAHDSVSLQNKVVFLAVRCNAGVCEWREGPTGSWDAETPGTDTATSPEFLVGASIFGGGYGDISPTITHSLVWAYSKSLSDAEITQNFNFAGGQIAARTGETLEGYVPPPANQPPSVTLASPAGGPWTAPATINLTATADDSDGTVSRVDFLADGSVIGSDTASPYSYTWTGVAAGTYSLVARAVDNLDASTDSTPVPVTVDAGGGPSPGGLTLFTEDFSGDMSAWTVVDEGTVEAPSAWSIVNQALKQTSNIYEDPPGLELQKLGTYVLAGQSGWTDYSLSARMMSQADNDALGLMFGYQDANNYYRFSMDQQRSYRRLVKVVNGVFTELAADTFSYTAGAWYEVQAVMSGGTIQILFNGTPLFTVNDSSHASGRIALYSWGNTDTNFDDVTVTSQAGPFTEDFSGDMSAWSIVDEGTVEGPSAWSIVNQALKQTSNIFDNTQGLELPKLGTYALAGQSGWTDYRFSARMMSQDDDGLGLMFGYQDANNYYRFSMDSQRSYRRLVKVVNGVFTELAGDTVSYATGVWYEVQAVMSGGTIQILFDGAPLFTISDSSHTAGRIALYSWGNTDANFDDVEVTSQTGLFSNSYGFRRTITAQASQVAGSGSHANFPVLVSLTLPELRSSGNGGSVQHVSGYDIRFESGAGAKLNHEIEKWDATTGELVAWVQAPSLSATSNTALYLYYGNSSISTPEQNSAGVWPTAEYGSVWHLAGDPSLTAPQALDSSSNGNDGTAQGAMTSTDRVDGKIAWATDLDGVDDRFTIPDSPSLSMGTSRTWSAWVKIDAWGTPTKLHIMELLTDDGGSCYSAVWRIGSQGLASLNKRVGHTVFTGAPSDIESTSELTLGTWTLLHVTSDGTQTRFYIDGALDATVAHAVTPASCTDDFTLGGNATTSQSYRTFDGQVDEMRVLPGAIRSADWIATEYNNQNSPGTFVSVGSEETAP